MSNEKIYKGDGEKFSSPLQDKWLHVLFLYEIGQSKGYITLENVERDYTTLKGVRDTFKELSFKKERKKDLEEFVIEIDSYHDHSVMRNYSKRSKNIFLQGEKGYSLKGEKNLSMKKFYSTLKKEKSETIYNCLLIIIHRKLYFYLESEKIKKEVKNFYSKKINLVNIKEEMQNLEKNIIRILDQDFLKTGKEEEKELIRELLVVRERVIYPPPSVLKAISSQTNEEEEVIKEKTIEFIEKKEHKALPKYLEDLLTTQKEEEKEKIKNLLSEEEKMNYTAACVLKAITDQINEKEVVTKEEILEHIKENKHIIYPEYLYIAPFALEKIGLIKEINHEGRTGYIPGKVLDFYMEIREKSKKNDM